MRSHAPVLCLLAVLAVPVVAQGYSTDFESFTASPTGDPCSGQDGFYIPVAGSLDGFLYLYPLNPLGVPQNPNGGAIALGHPLRMFGARLVLTATEELQRRGGRYALAAMCIGVESTTNAP